MTDEQQEILHAIETAFGRTPPPEGRCIPGGASLEAIRVKNFFVGKPWWEITMDSLRDDYRGDPSACLTFMAAPARFYYLPTYLVMAVTDYLEADVMAASLSHKLICSIEQEDRDQPHSIKNLSESKHRAIAMTLRYIRDNYPEHESDEFNIDNGARPDTLNPGINLYWMATGILSAEAPFCRNLAGGSAGRFIAAVMETGNLSIEGVSFANHGSPFRAGF